MGSLLVKLAAKEILPSGTVLKIREYISKKYPALSLAKKAAVFADAVNRILDDKLPEIPGERVKQFKIFLFSDAAAKSGFCIDGSDIFRSALKLRISDERFIAGLGNWMENTLKIPVNRNKLQELVALTYQMMDKSPNTDLDGSIDLAEQTVGDVESGGPETVAYGNAAEFPAATGNLEAVYQEAADCCTESDSHKTPADGISAIEQMTVSYSIDTGNCMIPLVPQNTGIKKAFPVKRKTLRAIAAVGLVGVSVLLSYYSALYINATENAGLTRKGDTAITEQEEIPAVVVVPSDPKDKGNTVFKMTATAYDLSFESCGKDRSHPAYGVTSSGTRATVGRTIAVDPTVIPLGSRVKITFPKEYSYLDGIYIAEDTGRLIKGNRVDVFFGEDKAGSRTVNKLAMEFGVRNVEVEILN